MPCLCVYVCGIYVCVFAAHVMEKLSAEREGLLGEVGALHEAVSGLQSEESILRVRLIRAESRIEALKREVRQRDRETGPSQPYLPPCLPTWSLSLYIYTWLSVSMCVYPWLAGRRMLSFSLPFSPSLYILYIYVYD